jgi:hypothetical protein
VRESELHFRFDRALGAKNTFRAGRWATPSGDQWLIELRIDMPGADCVEFRCQRFGRDIPRDRNVPNLSRIGEHEWRIEARPWNSVLPPWAPIVLTGWDGA